MNDMKGRKWNGQYFTDIIWKYMFLNENISNLFQFHLYIGPNQI